MAVITQAEVIGRYLPRLVAGDGDAMVPLAIALGIVGPVLWWLMGDRLALLLK